MKVIWKVVGFYNSEPVVEFNCKTRKMARQFKKSTNNLGIYSEVSIFRVVVVGSVSKTCQTYTNHQIYKKVY